MDVDLEKIKPSRQVRTVLGLRLPYRRKTNTKWVPATMADIEQEPSANLHQKGPGEPIYVKRWEWEEGTVFIDQETLLELSEQGQWDSQFGKVLLINDPRQEAALENAGLGVKETRGGFHRTDALLTLLQRLKWM